MSPATMECSGPWPAAAPSSAQIGQRARLAVDTALHSKLERLIVLGFVESRRNLGGESAGDAVDPE